MSTATCLARLPIGIAFLVLFPAAASSAAFAARDAFKVAPGPAAMSDEEKAIQPDPARGAEHGVILVEETDRNDNLGRWMEISFHQRAKILSNEGRRLADITIPFDIDADQLSQWWARIILPDGKVIEVPKEELTEQAVVKTRGEEYKTLKVALPGVVPGAVIDYGFTLRTAEFLEPDTVWLQREWPVQLLRYRWAPYARLASGYLCRRIAGLDVTPTVKDGKVVIEARDIRPVPDEPMMPPRAESKASAVFYYYSSELDAHEYWDAIAKVVELENGFFLSKAAVNELVERAAPPAGEAVTPKLQAVYDWLGANIEDVTTRTMEAEELAGRAKDRREEDTARFVMQKRRGETFQIAQLFVGAARKLGAEAWIALAADRTENYFNKALLSLGQFEWALVAVRTPDGPQDRFVFLAPGSGLPYGELPWWLTGVDVLVAAKEGPLPVRVPASEAPDNVGTTQAKITFSPEGDTADVSWTTRGTGQHGYSRWRALRRMKPDEREKELLEICGAGGGLEISDARAEGLAEVPATERISCTGELLAANVEAGIARYSFAIGGPWIPALPDLRPGPRRFPVVFDFPSTERTTIEVEAPAGFEPDRAPLAERLGTVYGSYALTVTRTERGFRVERELTLPRLNVPPESYTGLVGFLDGVRRGDATTLPFQRKAEGR
jgi:hypothetical protein